MIANIEVLDSLGVVICVDNNDNTYIGKVSYLTDQMDAAILKDARVIYNPNRTSAIRRSVQDQIPAQQSVQERRADDYDQYVKFPFDVSNTKTSAESSGNISFTDFDVIKAASSIEAFRDMCNNMSTPVQFITVNNVNKLISVEANIAKFYLTATRNDKTVMTNNNIGTKVTPRSKQVPTGAITPSMMKPIPF